MDDRLNYHTSLNNVAVADNTFLKSIQYHRALQSSTIALENLKKFNKNLDENNMLTNAFLANNPYISNEEREIFNKQMKEKALEELHLYESTLEKWRKRKEEGGFTGAPPQ